ncbi:YebC/PmpR family DNA-binding transcriptional regulator [Candidatus Peregrinibacteria bacterium CG11_big_fil_rev_8_21_14_0_20_41_10]|nr:MAG: YebC/PmpR family DNA-binding transcriptional regulator [Candidatus Peregrinibacteria bacterium CG11_big_fil_rev_8_21_14_0_20_41_10]PIZ76834.1 MAG: YebC/PmpR family DNA-binding transcriptional regulator [Candidatus Peregrinibacteria bacterium CG_4_10_14_0_2_um_filter_41_8]PJC38104.1 MAG: YebC/PmpR family DNA-binding transcriptional regulator [Candidatus Peregrinibacteria bacterium CG_4_9_14_0_2_um_filter_41_14]
MSGHSKWNSIKHKKANNDARLGKLFTRHAKLITLAARDGGGDPEMNAALRTAIANAKVDNTPNKNIERAVKRGTGELDDGKELVEVYYEGYGPSGVAFYIHSITDNTNRSYANIRIAMSKNGGNLGEAGCVGWMFERKGMITVPLNGKDADEAQLELIETGADDFDVADEDLIVYSPFTETQTVAEAIEAAGYKIKQKEITFLPKQTVEINDQAAADKLFVLVEALEDDEDVQTVYMNADFGDNIEG